MTWFAALLRCLGKWRKSDDLTPFSGEMPPFEARIDANGKTTFIRYISEENFIVENNTIMESSHISHQGDRGSNQNVEENKDLANKTASDRSTIVGNTGTETQLSTPSSEFDRSNITGGNADDYLSSAGGPSVTRAPSPPSDHPVEVQRLKMSTYRDSGEIIILPEPGLPETVSGCYLNASV
ncbi:hypothetical protein ETB97_007791 [Aspergillus alliaceus]|uniref:Uncharacterized protein n=1 Tax=Petromyces alliaceus TaxID=209559 RepID=A0A8H5ZTT0_PETAA|nr:hypothetical protein ETB97_007791 [Aspergillus burnettii]